MYKSRSPSERKMSPHSKELKDADHVTFHTTPSDDDYKYSEADDTGFNTTTDASNDKIAPTLVTAGPIAKTDMEEKENVPTNKSQDDANVDAATVAARDPLGPEAPPGTGLEKGTTTSATKEGMAQMLHENPPTVVELIKSIIGLGEPHQRLNLDPIALDGNTSNLSNDLLMEIAKRFQPLLWLAAHERYRPCTVEAYLQNSKLWYDPVGNDKMSDYILVKDGLTENDLDDDTLFTLLNEIKSRTYDVRLANLTKENMVRRHFHMSVRPEAEAGVPFEDINSVPMLCRLRRYNEYWEIVYVFFFAYNGPYHVCGRDTGAHSCDIEHVTIRTNWNATKLISAYFGSHGSADGVWRLPSQIEARTSDMPWPTRVVAYASDFSHGIYPSTGTWIRMCGFASDRISTPPEDERSLWNPTVDPVLLFHANDPRYQENAKGIKMMNYPGTMGEDGISPPQNQGWFYFENEYSNNWFRRGFFVCRYIEWEGDHDFCNNLCEWKFQQPAPDSNGGDDEIDWRQVEEFRAKQEAINQQLGRLRPTNTGRASQIVSVTRGGPQQVTMK